MLTLLPMLRAPPRLVIAFGAPALTKKWTPPASRAPRRWFQDGLLGEVEAETADAANEAGVRRLRH
jgi:hypothetical protein